MSAWQFTDATNKNVWRLTANGGTHATLAANLSAAELAATLPADPPPAVSQEELDVISVRGHAKLTALRALTPAQAGAWVQTNVVTLADAKDLLATMASAMAVLARRL